METRPQDRPVADSESHLARYTVIAHLLDQAFRVPGTPWRFGIDALIGLLPGAGDVAGSLLGIYGIWIARRMGAPASVQGRMLLNLIFDALAGAVPLIGDLFDFAFKAHVRNRVLLEKWLAKPTATRRTSAASLLGIVAVLLAGLAGSLWLAIASFRWLAGQITSSLS